MALLEVPGDKLGDQNMLEGVWGLGGGGGVVLWEHTKKYKKLDFHKIIGFRLSLG